MAAGVIVSMEAVAAVPNALMALCLNSGGLPLPLLLLLLLHTCAHHLLASLLPSQEQRGSAATLHLFPPPNGFFAKAASAPFPYCLSWCRRAGAREAVQGAALLCAHLLQQAVRQGAAGERAVGDHARGRASWQAKQACVQVCLSCSSSQLAARSLMFCLAMHAAALALVRPRVLFTV